MTMTRGVATPTLSLYIFSTLRTSSPVPDSRMTASAICDTVIIAIQRCWRREPLLEPAPSLRLTLASALAECHAGTMPNPIPTVTQIAAMMANTDGSIA